ncbi:MAG: hypothetical protein BroJett038_13270 [Chloroflexota bacterium]|nr:MAG: hypothetical protein BroJett038_13270 [Chloroflexota bacterium]
MFRALRQFFRAIFGGLFYPVRWLWRLFKGITEDSFMRGRERLFSTAAIWIAFAVMMNNIFERFMRVTADFTGLWPTYPVSPGGGFTDVDWDRWQRMVSQAQGIAQDLMSQVIAGINQQFDDRMGPMILLAFIVTLAAVVSTFFIWRNAGAESEPQARKAARADKAKRGEANSRVDVVINTLDEYELAELRNRLETVENEPVSFEELLAQQDEARRRGR